MINRSISGISDVLPKDEKPRIRVWPMSKQTMYACTWLDAIGIAQTREEAYARCLKCAASIMQSQKAEIERTKRGVEIPGVYIDETIRTVGRGISLAREAAKRAAQVPPEGPELNHALSEAWRQQREPGADAIHALVGNSKRLAGDAKCVQPTHSYLGCPCYTCAAKRADDVQRRRERTINMPDHVIRGL